MTRDDFFEWLDAITEDEYNKNKPVYYQPIHDDGMGTLTIQFYNVEKTGKDKPDNLFG